MQVESRPQASVQVSSAGRDRISLRALSPLSRARPSAKRRNPYRAIQRRLGWGFRVDVDDLARHGGVRGSAQDAP